MEPGRALATAAASLSFFQISSADHTCGITTDNRLYCWGKNDSGEVGDGTTIDRVRPVAVAPSLRFKLVSTYYTHTCAVTTDSRVYCWGGNAMGQLGDGTTTRHLTPQPVAGIRTYRQVDVGAEYSCAIGTADDRAYCWGSNFFGRLGIGVGGGIRTAPTPVAGARQFRQVHAGTRHACAVTPANLAFCWGDNSFGAIGDSSSALARYAPVRVAGSHEFVQINAGADFSCAVTTTGRAYCWGNGREGEIGDGKAVLRFWPRAVAGGLTFRRVSASGKHACGETPASKVYCWGDNRFGALGDGSTTNRLKPVPVLGGLSFSQISAGTAATCGRTSAGVGYCWGFNLFGQLGDGSHTDRLKPVKIVAPS
jgi:alpha-tubulin suppressor-like RCC1 family protein